MEIQRLADHIERPELHRKLLGEYGGSYSIGITTTQGGPDQPAIRVRVEGSGPSDIPSEIVLDGEPVPVIVQTEFVPPRPLPLRVPIG